MPPIEDYLPLLQAMADAMPSPSLPEGEPPAGAYHAVLAQTFLVEDLEASLQSLADDMDLVPDKGELIRESSGAIQRARLQPAPDEHGAAIELIQVSGGRGRTADYYSAYGRGPFAIRLGTKSIDDLVKDLEARGTLWLEDTEAADRRRIVVDPVSIGGAQFEVEQIG
jgi:hypothetical protein